MANSFSDSFEFFVYILHNMAAILVCLDERVENDWHYTGSGNGPMV